LQYNRFERGRFLLRWDILAYLIIGLGVSLRLIQYNFNRSLWLDEAFLALNILNRSLLGLFHPLSYNQGAPVGFLIMEKIVVEVFNGSEYALRLMPLLFGIISLFLFYKLAQRYSNKFAILISLILFSVSWYLIYYSSEVKQYSSDVAIALLLLLLATRAIGTKKMGGDQATILGIIGAAAIWFSHPSVFILAGAGIILISAGFIKNKKNNKEVIKRVTICSFWFLSLIICYFTSLRYIGHNDVLLQYWSANFMPFPPSNLEKLQWFPNTFNEILKNPVGLSSSGIVLVSILAGGISLYSKDREKFFLLILPIVFCLIASGFHKYPFGGRLVLFIAPIILLFVGEGAERIAKISLPHRKLFGIAFLALLIIPPSLLTKKHLLHPYTREEIKPVISYVRTNWNKGDILYLYYGSQYAFKYYSKLYGFGPNDYIVGVSSRNNWKRYQDDLSKLSGHKRVWILFSHICCPWKGVNEELFFLEYLDRAGKRLASFRTSGASAYLYDLENIQ